jgi:hypothetical protein
VTAGLPRLSSVRLTANSATLDIDHAGKSLNLGLWNPSSITMLPLRSVFMVKPLFSWEASLIWQEVEHFMAMAELKSSNSSHCTSVM